MPGRRWLPRPAAPCRHGHHLRRLCGLARLLARPTHTDLNGAELESTVPGILPNLGANARVTPPAAASSRRASAAGSPWRPRREGQLCSTASRQPWRRSRDDEREVDAMVEEAGSWRAQPSRTPSQRLGARRERATERDREDGAEQSSKSFVSFLLSFLSSFFRPFQLETGFLSFNTNLTFQTGIRSSS